MIKNKTEKPHTTKIFRTKKNSKENNFFLRYKSDREQIENSEQI